MARPDMTRVVFAAEKPNSIGEVFERRIRVASIIQDIVRLLDPDGDFVVAIKVRKRFADPERGTGWSSDQDHPIGNPMKVGGTCIGFVAEDGAFPKFTPEHN